MRDQAPDEPEILLEQPHFLVVNKPAGLFTQAAKGIDSVQNRLVELLARRDSHPGNPFIGLPHRLDRETTGALLVARNQRALKRFGEQFHSRKISKFYLAIVCGSVTHPMESWHDSVRKIPELPMAEICSTDANGAKPAHLDMLCLGMDDGLSVLLIKLHTGRMHQIRIQAASRGHPIFGDELYANSTSGHWPEIEKKPKYMALHSLRIEFRHPQTAKLTVATAPIPAAWKSLNQHQLAIAERIYQDCSRSHGSPWNLDNIKID